MILVDPCGKSYFYMLGKLFQMLRKLTSRITILLVYKVINCVQVTNGTSQREWGVTSLVD